jgi:uncharacterized protein YuzE
MGKAGSFDVHYDADSDVLYVRNGRGAAARGMEDENGIVWRYDGEGTIVGATVVDLRRRWLGREHILTDELSRRLRIPATKAKAAVERALEADRPRRSAAAS